MRRVLLAEDEKYTRAGIRDILQKEFGELLEINECRNGAAALLMLADQKIDILVTDIRMPKINGIELIKEIKKRKLGTRIIILTGYEEFSYMSEAIRCGAKAYLMKPIRKQQLLEVMNEILEELHKEEDDKEKFNLDKEMLRQSIRNQLSYIFTSETMEEAKALQMINTLNLPVLNRNYYLVITEVLENPGGAGSLGKLSEKFLDRVKDFDTVYFYDNKQRIVFITGDVSWVQPFREYIETEGIAGLTISVSQASGSPGNIRKLYYDAVEQLVDNRRGTMEIDQAIRFIHENYFKDVNLAVVANQAGLNYNYFSGLFKKCTGVSFSDYLKRVRMEIARDLLLSNREMKVAEIGGKVGYANDKHFMKDFKELTGITPTHYRDIY